MKRTYIVLFFLSFIFNFSAIAQKPLVQYDRIQLLKLKTSLKLKKAPKETEKQYRKLLKKADELLEVDNPTVINKVLLPPSKNKNDYLSISRYWWPDETKTDGYHGYARMEKQIQIHKRKRWIEND